MSNRFMRVALHLKRDLTERKSDEQTKTPSSFAYRKVYSLLHYLVDVEKGETTYEKLVHPLNKTKRNSMWGKKSRLRSWIIFHLFCCSSNTHLLTESVFTGSCLGLIPLSGTQPKIGGSNNRLSLNRREWSSTAIFASRPAINKLFSSLLSSIHCSVPFSLEFLPANQKLLSIRCRYVFIFNLRARCYDDLDFGNLSFSISFVSPFFIYVPFFSQSLKSLIILQIPRILFRKKKKKKKKKLSEEPIE